MAQLIKTIFFGTSEFAVPALEILIKEGYEITAVITNPDEPTGRKQVPTPPPVKIAAQKFGLRILQPEKLKGNQEFFSELKNLLQTTNYPSSRAKLATGHGKLQTSIGIVASYGKIIPKEIINTFKHGILNIHPSLLPKYRGPTPIQSAILSGGQETGVTIIKIDEQIDHGPILINQKSKIKNQNFEESQSKLAKLGAELLIKILPDYLSGKIKPVEQDHNQATFTKMIKKEDGKIDWNKSAEEIYNQFRAFHLWPGIWTIWNPLTSSGQAKTLKITNCAPRRSLHNAISESLETGVVIEDDDRTFVSCGSGYLEILRLQLEGGKEMDVKIFLAGHKNFVNSKLE